MSGLILPFQGLMPKIDPSAYIADNAAVIGDVEIGANSSIWFACVLRGDVHEIKVGCDTNIQDGTVVHVTANRFGTYIGSRVTIGHAAVIHACTIEDDAFVGMGATLLDGVVVETGAMVAAGAVVPPGKRVKKGELWAGNPAKIMRPLRQDEIDHFPVSAANYVELARQYR